MRPLDLTPRRLRTQFGGLFLFMPWLVQLPFEQRLKSAGLPDSRQIPAGATVCSRLGLKLFGNARHSHMAFFGGISVVLSLASLALSFPLFLTYAETGLVPRFPNFYLISDEP